MKNRCGKLWMSHGRTTLSDVWKLFGISRELLLPVFFVPNL
jgi:hypothetical protein